MDVRGKRVLVVGLGKSGVASAIFLQSRGAKVTVSDAKSEAQLRQEIPQLLDRGITVETGHHGERTFRDQDMIVISPGVPFDQPQLEQARSRGIQVIGEIELAAQFVKGHIVAITGSNGKTTTTSLCGDILTAGGRKTLVGGNIGTPAISFADEADENTWSVLEISSFQLETIQTFRPQIAAILNITPDHLDRHRTFANYAAAKERIFENQRPSDFAVLNADNEPCVEIGKRVKSKVLWFSRRHEVERGAFVRGGKIVFRIGPAVTRDRGSDELDYLLKTVGAVDMSATHAEREIMRVDDMLLKGAHNVENVLAAVCVGVAAGISPEQIRSAVSQFKAVEHRLEYTATVNGVEYYNDSKATNVDATVKALESFPKGVHLILGGKDKGSPYTVLNDLLRERVSTVYTIGAAASKIEAEVKGVEVVHAETLENAVKLASSKAVSGDIVLLAPACASFDQFQSYEHRGRVFKGLVQQMKQQEKR